MPVKDAVGSNTRPNETARTSIAKAHKRRLAGLSQPAAADGRHRKPRFAVPFLWVVPGAAFAVAVHFVMVGVGAWYAFTDWDGASSANWVGLDNFLEIFTSPLAQGALVNTIELTVACVVASNAIGLALALGLHRTIRTRNFLRSLFFVPVVLSSLAVSYIWQFILDANGPFNQFLNAVGLGSWGRPWLADPSFAKWAVLVVLVWQYSGLAMAFYLAGLQNIPEEIEDAAAVDGASTIRRLRSITLPLLAPAMTASITMITVFATRVFDQVLALTGGGPAGASETLATQVYTQTFVAGRFGYGAALALVLTALVLFISVGLVAVLRSREKKL